jgi:2-polyprenyl-3-methyl-5-hydroxy-6-metoxy-1,4-benzoquinol methylase
MTPKSMSISNQFLIQECRAIIKKLRTFEDQNLSLDSIDESLRNKAILGGQYILNRLDKSAVRRGFDGMRYASFRANEEEIYRNARKLTMLKRPIHRILSVGAGPLIYEALLLNLGFANEIVAVDLSEKIMQRSIEALDLSNVKIVAADFENFEIIERFDLILCASSIHWFSDPQVTLNRLCTYAELYDSALFITTYRNFFSRDVGLGVNSVRNFKSVSVESMIVPHQLTSEELEILEFIRK